MKEFSFVPGCSALEADRWDRLVGDGMPFHEWGYLRSIENGSATVETGLRPCHLLSSEGGELTGVTPLYVMEDGRFDLFRNTREDYPKVAGMTPFAPITGKRFLGDPGPLAVRRRVGEIESRAVEEGARSVEFQCITHDEAEILSWCGYRVYTFPGESLLDLGGMSSLDDYLASFPSRRRNALRREFRRMEEGEREFECLQGDAIGQDDMILMARMVGRICQSHGTDTDHLAPDTWRGLVRDWSHRLLLFFASERGVRIAGALCVQKGAVLYGRYWGAVEPLPGLHFEVAVYQPLLLALGRGWRFFHGGYVCVEHKRNRGFKGQPYLWATKNIMG